MKKSMHFIVGMSLCLLFATCGSNTLETYLQQEGIPRLHNNKPETASAVFHFLK